MPAADYCRPIKFIFAKESPPLISPEKPNMDKIISDLVANNIHMGDHTTNITYNVLNTIFTIIIVV